MNLRPVVTILPMLSLAVVIAGQAPPNPPVAKIDPKVTVLHNEKLVDNYHWLREKGSAEVTAYLEAENAYTEAGTKHTAALQEVLYAELLGRIKETDANVPYLMNGYWYYSRTEQGKSYPIFCRKKGTLEAPEEIVLDQNELAAGKRFHALGGMDVSPDGSKLLYLEDLTAFREYTLHVRDLAQGRNIESIPNVWNGTAWADDNRTFFYMTADAAKRGNAVWRHVIGSPRGQDVNVFREDNNLYNVTVLRSRSEKFIFIPADGFTSSEWRAIPSATPAVAPKVIQPRRPNVEYSVEHGGGFFYIHTNDQAKNFKIVRVPDSDPARSSGRIGCHIVPKCSSKASRSSVDLRWSSNGAAGCAVCAWSACGKRLPRHRVSRARLWRIPDQQPGIRYRPVPFQLFVVGHAIVRVRLRHGEPAAGTEEASGDSQRLRSVAV